MKTKTRGYIIEEADSLLLNVLWIGISFFFCGFFLRGMATPQISSVTFENYQHHTVKGIEVEIVSKAVEHNVDPIVALRIAKCESHYGKYPKNFEGSSAVGIYQFMPKTFGYCQGDINNNSDQIKCFMELYPKHKSWWKCK